VLLPAATLAVAATSAVHYPDAVRAAVLDGRLAAGIGSGNGAHASGAVSWRVSDDAGATWRDPTTGEDESLTGTTGPGAGPVSRGCSTVMPTRCYRVVPGRLGVEQSDDGGRSWRPAWGASEAQRAILIRQYPDPGPDGERLTAQELTVQDTGDGRHVVLVANGRDGFALRGPDGNWERLGFLDDRVGGYPFDGRPPALGRSTPADRGADPLLALLVGLVLGGSVLAVSGVRAGLRAGTGPWQPACLAALGAVAGALLAVVWSGAWPLWQVAVVALFVVLLGMSPMAVAPARSPATPHRWTLEVLLATALTLALTALPLVGWLYGRPAYARTAVLLAVAAAVPGLLLGWRAARLVGAPAEAVDPPWPAPPATPPPR
jgi:hypothetical protein